MKKQKIALVLSSGGARGLTHIGVIEELERRGYEITSVSGTSIGSVIGGSYASGHLEGYKNWLVKMTKAEVFRLMDFTLSGYGLMKGEKVFEEMRKHVPETKIEDMAVPFAAVATNIDKMKEEVFTSGSLYEALRASVAIPTVFTPAKHPRGHLVDGGLLHPVPIEFVKRTPGDIVVAVNLNASKSSHCHIQTEEEKKREESEAHYQTVYQKLKHYLPKRQKEKLSYVTILNTTTALMLSRISEYEIMVNKPEVVVNISRNVSTTFEFYNAKKLIETGRKAAAAAMDEYEKNK